MCSRNHGRTRRQSKLKSFSNCYRSLFVRAAYDDCREVKLEIMTSGKSQGT